MRSRRGLTLVELLVVVAIVGLLMALLLPAVQSARESARRISCSNNLKQQALGVQGYHTAIGRLPPSRIADHKPTWLVLILPHVEQAAFFAEWDLTRCVYDAPLATRTRLVPTYLCPSRGGSRAFVNDTVYGHETNHASAMVNGKVPMAYVDYACTIGRAWPSLTGGTDYDLEGAMITGRIDDGQPLNVTQFPNVVETRPWYSLTSFAHIRDGLSNTLLLSEWTAGTAAARGGYNGDSNPGIYGGPSNPIAVDPALTQAMGSDHPGVCNVAFCDSSTRPLRADISATVLGQLVTRRGGEVVSPDEF